MIKDKEVKYTMEELRKKSRRLINKKSFFDIPFKDERVMLLPCLKGEDHYSPEMHEEYCWREYVTYVPAYSPAEMLDAENRRFVANVHDQTIWYWVRPWNVIPMSQIALESTVTKIKRLIYD